MNVGQFLNPRIEFDLSESGLLLEAKQGEELVLDCRYADGEIDFSVRNIGWPERMHLHQNKVFDLAEIGTLHFHRPDTERFPLLKAAYDAGRKGGNLPAVMNAANEAANLAFRNHEISFLDIEDIVIGALKTAVYMPVNSPEDLEAADAWGWGYALEKIEELK